MSDGSIGDESSALFSDSDLLPLSALQHLVYCERQCMLIHVEGAWSENKHTAEGRRLHERTHGDTSRIEDGKLVARGLRLVSHRLGLAGAADVVEFHPAPSLAGAAGNESADPALELGACNGTELPGRPGRWQPYPVEYKRGRPKSHDADAVQLCAQAVCLEEMLGAAIPIGALFYGKTRRRKEVRFDAGLRGRVEVCAARLHQLVTAGVTPAPAYDKKKCQRCSLEGQCVPRRPASARAYLHRMLTHALEEHSP